MPVTPRLSVTEYQGPRAPRAVSKRINRWLNATWRIFRIYPLFLMCESSSDLSWTLQINHWLSVSISGQPFHILDEGLRGQGPHRRFEYIKGSSIADGSNSLLKPPEP